MRKTKISLAILAGLAFSNPTLALDKYKLSQTKSLASEQQSLDLLSQQKTKTWLVRSGSESISSSAAQSIRSGSVDTDFSAEIQSANASLDTLEAQINSLGLNVVVKGRTTNLATALIVDGSMIEVEKLTSLSSVFDILPVYDYKPAVADSAEYINATSVVRAGKASGSGVSVAVLDTGVDYTHELIGGPGTQEDYDAATLDLSDTPAWPIGRVVGGFDYINNDPDPMDNGIHGTHVAHSVLGVAPNADIYAYTVCTSVSCPGEAQLAALEASIDPNGDGDIFDRVDIINMSLGGDYGTSRGGAVGALIDRAVELGVVVAISAGNDGAFPYIVGGPSTTRNAISVGAMTHPVTPAAAVVSYVDNENISAEAAAFNPEFEFEFDESNELVYPTEENNLLGCLPYGSDFTGKTVLIDRGECAFSSKVINAQKAGAEFVVIANNKPGEGSFVMSGTPSEPLSVNAVMISSEDGSDIKRKLSVGSVAYSFSSSMKVQPGAIASFTSRGPSVDGHLKPEITAPGVAIDTALAGSVNGTSPINGTSFSSPITAGAFSLLKEAFPNRTAFELKAVMMNSANLDITTVSREVIESAELAPISVIGAGLVDVEKAISSPIAIWAADTRQAALSYGLVDTTEPKTIIKEVIVKNFSGENKEYDLTLSQRYKDDIDSGALSMEFPQTISVPAGQSISLNVSLNIDPSKLPEWNLDSELLASVQGTDVLTRLEYDGALLFTDRADTNQTLHLVYHALPKALAKASISSEIEDAGVVQTLTNDGAVAWSPSFLPLTVNSGVDSDEFLDLIAGSVEVLPVPSDFCSEELGVFSTFVMRDGILSPHVGGFFVDFDIDADGIMDYTAQALAFNVFDRSNRTGVFVSFTRPFSALSGSLNNTFHTSGEKEFTLLSCPGALGLTASELGSANVTAAFRVEDSSFDFFPSAAYPEKHLASGLTLGQRNDALMPVLVNESGALNPVLASGESASILGAANGNFITAFGVETLIVPLRKSTAPVIQDQSFEVEENSVEGTIIGTLVASDIDEITSPISEFYVVESSSSSIRVSRSGVLEVSGVSNIDFDAGLTDIVAKVVAIDTEGNVSEPATISISVLNLADEPSEQPVPAPVVVPDEPQSSGGSFGWLVILQLVGLMLIRRRNVKTTA